MKLKRIKTYADECLERAEGAAEGPWRVTPYEYGFRILEVNGCSDWLKLIYEGDAEFIAHARTDVPELSRRLKHACMVLRANAVYWKNAGADDSFYALNKLAENLEAMPEEEK